MADTQTEAKAELDVLIRARYPLIYVVSWEEQRVEDILREIAGQRRQTFTWSVTRPFGVVSGDSSSCDGVTQALNALAHIEADAKKSRDPTLFILRDLDPFMEDPTVVRRLRDLAHTLKTNYKTVVIVSPNLNVPAHLEKDLTVVDFPLPGLPEMAAILGELLRTVEKNPSVQVRIDDAHREKLLKSALGLTAEEAANVFAKALVLDGSLDNEDVQVVLSEKKQIIRKSGLLEYYSAEESFAEVGGLEHLKEWLRKRTAAFTERARKFGLPQPRGTLLLGVQGCGKSLCAKAVSGLWNLPLLRFDLGSVFGKYIGESEANIRKALKTADSLAPCVLWLDELEKAFSGTGGSDDGGTTSRVLGTFLTWLQEKTSPVFVIATANDVSKLPPELLRKGRLDEIFFVDLPSVDERRRIFEIHLRKRRRNPAAFDFEHLAGLAEGFSGAEIEQAIIEGLYDAFDQNRDLTTADVAANIVGAVPLSRTMGESVEHLREWARTRARPASKRTESALEGADAGLELAPLVNANEAPPHPNHAEGERAEVVAPDRRDGYWTNLNGPGPEQKTRRQ